MNKRSATLMAAALVGVLTIGGTAFSLGLTGPTASAAADRTTTAGSKPVVRTQTTTVTVHRQAPSATPVVVQVSSSNSGPSASAGPSDSSGPGHEGDDVNEDHHDGQDDDGDHGDHDGSDDHGDDDD